MPDITGPERDQSPAPVSPAVAALGQSLSEVLAEAQALRSDVHTAEEARRKATVVNLGLLALLVLFVALLGAVSWQNNQLIEKVEQTNSTMADCTTPGGRCYEEGNRRTSGAINDIIWASVYMAQCARLYPGEVGPEYDKKLEACVTQRLQQAAKERQATPTPTVPVPTVSPSPSGGG